MRKLLTGISVFLIITFTLIISCDRGLYAATSEVDQEQEALCEEHSWDSGVITKKGTCKNPGIKSYTCTVCGETKEESYLGDHKFKVVSKKKATLKKDGKITQKCSVCKKKKKEVIERPKTIALANKKLTYTGMKLKPAVIVKTRTGEPIEKKFYSVSYRNNKKVGKAKVTIKFKKDYSGKKVLSFKIYPRATEIIGSTEDSKGLTVRWRKRSEASGYQLQYSTDATFGSNVKKLKISGSKVTSKKIKGLAGNKKYYFRIRTYKGSSHSAWSSVEDITTKVKQESYDTIIKKYKDGKGHDTPGYMEYSAAYYKYVELMTPYGRQKALVITTYHGAYNMYSIIYVRNNSGKIVKFLEHSGELRKYTQDRKKLLLYGYAGSGYGSYYILEYKPAKNTYVETERYDHEMDNRDSVASTVNALTKDYSECNEKSYTIYGW